MLPTNPHTPPKKIHLESSMYFIVFIRIRSYTFCNMQYTKSGIGLAILLVAIVILAVPAIYDTDDTYAIITNRYGDIFSAQTPCTNDANGLGVNAVPFGVIATACHDQWFVLLNMIPIHTMDAGDSSGQAKAEITVTGDTGDAATDMTTYRVGSYLTFQIPKSGFTLIAGSAEGKYSLRVTDQYYDEQMTLTFVEDLSMTEDGDFFDLAPLSLQGVLRDYSYGSIGKSCDPRFQEKGSICNASGDDLVEVVPIDLKPDPYVDTYLVIASPFGMAPNVTGIANIYDSITLNPPLEELAVATEVQF